MADVEELEQIQTADWGGYLDPRLPEGVWFGEVTAVGDGSGGEIRVMLLTQRAGPRRDSRLYSMEQLSVNTALGASQDIQIQITNLGINPTEFGLAVSELNWLWVLPVRLSSAVSAFRAPSLADTPIPLGLFLGQQIAPLTDTGIRARVGNAALQQLKMTAGGYVWGARSRSAQGGPQRPATGIWSS